MQWLIDVFSIDNLEAFWQKQPPQLFYKKQVLLEISQNSPVPESPF